MDLLRLRTAARLLGVSYPTLKQWIYRGRIRSVKTPGGHHRIPESEVNRLLFQNSRITRRTTSHRKVVRLETTDHMQFTGLEHFISGRNQLVGRIVRIRQIGLLAEVVIDIGGQVVTSIITRRACHDLKLRVGETAAALIKATEVMIIRPPSIHTPSS
ncbi:MAG: TOBE domain-containing protein [Terriglobia bacterium]